MKLLQFNKSVIVPKLINSKIKFSSVALQKAIQRIIFTFGELFTFPDLLLAHVVCYVGEGSSVNNIF